MPRALITVAAGVLLLLPTTSAAQVFPNNRLPLLNQSCVRPAETERAILVSRFVGVVSSVFEPVKATITQDSAAVLCGALTKGADTIASVVAEKRVATLREADTNLAEFARLMVDAGRKDNVVQLNEGTFAAARNKSCKYPFCP